MFKLCSCTRRCEVLTCCSRLLGILKAPLAGSPCFRVCVCPRGFQFAIMSCHIVCTVVNPFCKRTCAPLKQIRSPFRHSPHKQTFSEVGARQRSSGATLRFRCCTTKSPGQKHSRQQPFTNDKNQKKPSNHTFAKHDFFEQKSQLTSVQR